MAKSKKSQPENMKSDPVAVKLALSHQLEKELDETGFDYIVLIIDKGENPDIAVATNRANAEIARLLRAIAYRLEDGATDLS